MVEWKKRSRKKCEGVLDPIWGLDVEGKMEGHLLRPRWERAGKTSGPPWAPGPQKIEASLGLGPDPPPLTCRTSTSISPAKDRRRKSAFQLPTILVYLLQLDLNNYSICLPPSNQLLIINYSYWSAFKVTAPLAYWIIYNFNLSF